MAVTVFGGGAVQTAYVSFAALDITKNSITLVWPTSYFDVPSIVDGIHYNVLAASLTVNDPVDNENTITLPNAMETSVGSNFIITNIGASSFKLLKYNGDELIVIPNEPNTSNSFWVQLINNATQEGDWQFVQFGAGTSQAQAAALSGYGLAPIEGVLNTNISVKSVFNSPYRVTDDDRAKLILWRGGVGIINLPPIGQVPAGFYSSFNNEGSGILTINGNATIDTRGSITISLGQSLSIISDGFSWWTLGFGQNIASSNFAPGSAISPSITFTPNTETGIYLYTGAAPAGPGVGFTVNQTPICNLTETGLYMNAGKSITLQDAGLNAQTRLLSNANYGQLTWYQPGLASPPTLNITGTDVSSTLTLGPFANLSFSQSIDAAVVIFNGIDVLFFDNDGLALFTHQVTFNGPLIVQNTSTFTAGATFNAPLTIQNSATFNGTSTFNGPIVFGNPLPIASGGTGQITRQLALNALMANAPLAGSVIYYDGANWVVLPPGLPTNVLTIHQIGGQNLPRWA